MISQEMIELAPRLTVLGILDADNYTPILILLFILAKPRGGVDGFWFTLGVVLTQFAGGVLFAYVVTKIDGVATPALGAIAVYGQILLGAGLVVLGAVWRPKRPRDEETAFLERMGHRPATWFSIGVFVEITKLMTAVVYFEAMRRIMTCCARLAEQLVLVIYFNAIAFAPMVLIWIVYLFVGAAHPERLTAARAWLLRHEPALIRFAFAAVGLFLVWNGLSLARA